MEQSRGLIRCNHSDEMRMLGREGKGVMAGTPDTARQQEEREEAGEPGRGPSRPNGNLDGEG